MEIHVDEARMFEEPEKENGIPRRLVADLNLGGAILRVWVIDPILGTDD